MNLTERSVASILWLRSSRVPRFNAISVLDSWIGTLPVRVLCSNTKSLGLTPNSRGFARRVFPVNYSVSPPTPTGKVKKTWPAVRIQSYRLTSRCWGCLAEETCEEHVPPRWTCGTVRDGCVRRLKGVGWGETGGLLSSSPKVVNLHKTTGYLWKLNERTFYSL